MAVFFRGKLPKGGLSNVAFRLPGAKFRWSPKLKLHGSMVAVAWVALHRAARQKHASKLDSWLTAQPEKPAKKISRQRVYSKYLCNCHGHPAWNLWIFYPAFTLKQYPKQVGLMLPIYARIDRHSA